MTSHFDNRGHRGHVMAHLAACRRSVGLSLLGQVSLFELRGSPAHLAALGEDLQACEPVVGRPVRTGWGWWQLDATRRVLVLADPLRSAELGRLLQRAAAPHLDIVLTGVASDYVGLVLAGPQAGSLAASPAVRLADPLLTVSEREDYRLLVLAAARARDLHETLLALGADQGAVSVDAEVTDLYRAAHRALTSQRRDVGLQSHTAMSRTGV